MLRVLLLLVGIGSVVAPAPCDTLTLLPCNISSRTCYIHANVCNGPDIIFGNFGASWTFSFVLYDVPVARCSETNGALSPACTMPVPSITVTTRSFTLSAVALQGIFNAATTLNTVPLSASAFAVVVLPILQALAPTGVTAVITVRAANFTSVNILYQSLIMVTAAILYVGPPGRLNISNAVFSNTSVGVVVATAAVAVVIAGCSVVNPLASIFPVGPVLLVLTGCYPPCTVSVTAASAHYILLDFNTLAVSAPLPLLVYNVSTIIPYTVTVPTAAPCPLPLQCTVPNVHMQQATIAVVIVTCVVVVAFLVRRHYQHLHARKSE